MIFRQLFFLLAGMFTALAAAIAVIIMNLEPDPPMDDIYQLILFMSSTGIATVLLAYIFNRRGMTVWFRSLRWSLLTLVVITVLLVLLNVWVTAQLMFIEVHDLTLTTALLVFAGGTSIIFGLFVASTITNRIRQLSGAAENIAAGKLYTRLEVRGNDELSDFANTFNWMADNLQKMDDQKRMIEKTRRDLIAWVSHDLRTPLTSIRAMLEAIADDMIDDPDIQKRYVSRSLGEVENLNRLINDLFELAKLDAGHFDATFFNASLRDLISDVISNVTVRADGQEVTLRGAIQQDIDPVYMAPDKIQRVLRNLIDNALQHTPSGGTITIRARRHNNTVRVDVHNTGSVILPEHLPHVFTSFYRVESARTRAGDGQRSTGLGLAIARGFVEAHHGSITVQSKKDKGTVFTFTLPALSLTKSDPPLTETRQTIGER